MVNNIEDLQEIWDMLDTCYGHPKKYIAEALEPIVKYRRYRAIENGAVREFYFLLRSIMVGAKRVGLLRLFISDQTLPSKWPRCH
jgi:hypothetical protein